MAVDNTAIGSALIIPDGLLNNLTKIDKKIKDIQDTSRATANVFNSSFASMSMGLKTGILTQLQQVINQLGSVGQAAQTASSATQNMGSGLGTAAQGATNLGTSVTGVVEAINRMIGQLQQTGQVGSSSLMAAKLAADKLMEAMQFKNTGNIAAIKDEILNINKTLKDTESALSRSEQQTLVERKRLLQEELKEAERTQNERAVNLQRVLDRMIRAEQSYQRQVEQARKKTAQDYQKQNYASNTTYSGSLSFADNANTINRRTQAIKYLTEARNALSKTDADYIDKLATLNAKIKELNAANRQAIASSQELNNNHRKLMDTAGQLQRAFALMFSVSQIRGYIGQIAKVRGEFELQQRSLEAILQNKTEADTIFNKTVALAVQSPFQIRELVSYTKQLAAYRIESDKLYDTTKRLADVSAGLGIDLSRLILAYGQVKAAAYLRGCLGYNTPIRMYDGSIKMVQDVQVGDVLINENGEKVNVKELIRGREKMYIINQLCGNDRTMYKVNANHILTLWNVAEQRLEDIYLSDYLKDTEQPYLGVKVQDNGERFYYAIEAIECGVDNYYGFVLDGNKRFLLGDGTITHNTEVRQFTEAGINLYGELQRYFQEVKGEAYTTAQIVDMISKRMVTFEDVEQIFKRITDQGGIFYRMQEIQAETLQGKIANFKDSVDVMMNEIGKDNEGLFKGAIDSATALLGHWEEIVNVGKTLVGVFLLLKTYSLQTGVAMSKVFTVNMMANATNTLKFTELLHYGFLNLSKSVKILGANLKAAFVTNLPMLAITALGMAIYETYDRISSYREAVAKSNKELVKARGAVADLTNEYNNLTTATNNAQKVQERNADPAKDIEARRNALQKLIDLAGKNGLTFEIKVAEVKDDELNAVFDGVKEKYERFLLDMAIIQKRHAENKSAKSWWFFSDAINEDANDYKNAVLEVLAQSDKLDTAISNVKTNYDNLSEASKKYYKEIAAGKKDGESEIDYYTRMYNAMLQINRLNVNTNTGVPKWLKATNTILKDISGDFKDIGTQAQEFTKELDDVLGDVIENARKRGATDIQIKPLIDKYAAEQGFDDIQKDLTYRHFNIKISIDKEETSKEISWVDNYLIDFFSKRTYSIKFDVTKPTSTDALKDFIKKGDDAAKAAKSWEEASKRIAAVGKNVKQITADSNIAAIMNANSLYNVKSGDKVDIKTLKGIIDDYRKVNADIANSLGVNPFEKQANKVAKAQRDILSEQISLLKEMQKRYEDLQSVMGKNDAIQSVLQYYSASLQNVKMPESIVKSFVPTKEGLIKALEQLLPTINDFKKKMDVRNTIAELKVQIDKEKLKTDLDKVKDEIEKAFNGLQLYKNLKDLGLSDVEVSKMFGNITKSFADVRKQIESDFTSKFGADQTKWGKDVADQYAEQMNKLDKQIYENSVSQFKELSKAYKDELDERLKIDLWYAEERKKIEENEQLAKNPALKDEFIRNLEKQRAQKSDEADWKQFQNSDFYIRIFENLETTSSRVLTAMQEKLASLRGSLKNLSPEQLKQVVDQMEKVDSQLVQRNPFKGLVSGIKDYIKFAKQRKQLETEYLQSIKKEDDLQSQKDTQTQAVENAKQRYELAVKIFGMYSPEAAAAERLLKVEQDKLKVILDEAVAQGKITEELRDQILAGEKAQKKISGNISSIANGYREISGAVGEFTDMLSNFGVNIPEELTGVLSGIGQTIDGLESIDLTKPMSIITGSVKTIAGIGNTIGSIFGFGNKDKKLQKEIEKQEKIVTRLQRTYEKLKKSMDDAWSAASVIQANEDTKANIEQQIDAYEKMIASEKDKKDSDSGKIEEWKGQIDDLKLTLKELDEQLIESMGGFGSEANYKSAAQEFADAWVDAFNESGDTLKALEDKFDDFFNNLIKKQLMQRAAQKYIRPLFEAIDEAVSEGSEGGVALTAEEKDKIQKLKDMQLKGFDEYAKMMMELLNLKPDGGVLSKLQQGIEGITETTAQALESLLNSIRFFVAQQATDISAIRLLLQQINNVDLQTPNNTPMLTELKSQTTYLRQIRDTLSDVVRSSGHPKQGAGVKVFID